MKKILVIENEVTTRNFLIKCLNNKGFEAIGAENGLMGVELAKECSPLLVICNVKVQGLNSHSILKTLRQNPVTEIIPFVFIATEKTDNQLFSEHDLLSDSYDTYLTKPLQQQELLSAIDSQIQKQTILRQWCVSRKISANQAIEERNTLRTESIFPICNCSLLNKVFQFIEENYHQQINLGDVAEAIGYSTTYLTNLVKRQTQKGIYGWIIERRMAEARRLLLKTDESISWIAAKVGYPDSGHFSRLFRQNYSISPKAWRDTHSKKVAVQTLSKTSNTYALNVN